MSWGSEVFLKKERGFTEGVGGGRGGRHRLNMELDLQSLFGLHVHSWAHIRGRYRISQPR